MLNYWGGEYRNVCSFERHPPEDRLIERCLNRDIHDEASIAVTTASDLQWARTIFQNNIFPNWHFTSTNRYFFHLCIQWSLMTEWFSSPSMANVKRSYKIKLAQSDQWVWMLKFVTFSNNMKMQQWLYDLLLKIYDLAQRKDSSKTICVINKL